MFGKQAYHNNIPRKVKPKGAKLTFSLILFSKLAISN